MRIVVGLYFFFWGNVAMASELILAEVESGLVPGPVEYAVLLPGPLKDLKDVPLIFNLHGGGGSRDNLEARKPLWDRLWERDEPALRFKPVIWWLNRLKKDLDEQDHYNN